MVTATSSIFEPPRFKNKYLGPKTDIERGDDERSYQEFTYKEGEMRLCLNLLTLERKEPYAMSRTKSLAEVIGRLRKLLQWKVVSWIMLLSTLSKWRSSQGRGLSLLHDESEMVTISGHQDVRNDEKSLLKALAHQPLSVSC
ncbi:hypothetical protein Bca52824_033691 [Brassica carinata]|uniref:Uncharacterized protein n=1 Tax=Brassica carinata TaxID=52824 RepID=A0A8X7V6B2_BRACI|nr:hypothetical protein Bca52824_033691 [Brassica carinata]